MIEGMAEESFLLFTAASEFIPGIVGLVASRLLDEFYRPTVVVQKGKEISRGSCRSIPEFNITQALDECADLLIRHGGHAAAAGFTISNENLDKLATRLQDIAAQQLADYKLEPTLFIDDEIDLSQVSWDLMRDLAQLEPYGYENQIPLFVSRNVYAHRHKRVGIEKKHLKLMLTDGKGRWDAIAFRQGEWADQLPDYVDVVYQIETNEWNGRRMLQLNVQDLRPTQDH
jgi:single-stranded-DNA-specific exonuclease